MKFTPSYKNLFVNCISILFCILIICTLYNNIQVHVYITFISTSKKFYNNIVPPPLTLCSLFVGNRTCGIHQFRCPNGRCIPVTYKCDSDNDCRDENATDELNCSTSTCKYIERKDDDFVVSKNI